MNVLGRYIILNQLGAGAMGTVYRAKDSVLEREVALKTIRTSGTVDPAVRERFYREARACARLQHPSIVSVFDVGEIDRIAYISMELLRGLDFRRFIESKHAMTLAGKLEAMIQICEALDHAHRHGVIHRDVKPSNLFKQEDGPVKIVDFGIARLPSSQATLQTVVMGTPNYMSPEQLMGKPTDPRSDLFSAGLVFFELLVRAHPFQSTAIPTRIVEDEPDSLFDHDPDLPIPLETIITKRALARDPADRYTFGAELASDLRSVLDNIRDNASPSMSRLQLPSERVPIQPMLSVTGDPALMQPVPPGEDPAEWRLTEVLRLSFEFDEALERQDQAGARSALKQLRAIAAEDSRFVPAAEAYSQSFINVWGEDMEVVPTGGGGNGDAPVPPPDPKTLPATQDHGWKIRWPFLLPGGQTKLIAVAFAACALLILVAWTVSDFVRRVPQEPAIGSVAVLTPRAYIKEAPKTDAPVVAEVSLGDSIHLLSLPVNRSEAWLYVQASPGGKLAKPGYIPVSDVAGWGDWSLDSVGSAVKLTLMMCADDSAATSELQSCLSRWKALEPRAEGKVEEDVVRTNAERLEKLIASRQLPLVVPPPAGAPQPEALTADQMVFRGRRALEGAPPNPNRATYYAREALRLESNHAGALALLDDVRQYNAVFGKPQQ